MGKHFFCEGNQHHRDAREHGFNEVGSFQLCDDCYERREAALAAYREALRAEQVKASESRHDG